MAGPGSNNESTILDYLNEDCWRAVLNYVHVRDVIRTESTSRRWQDVVLTYLRNVRIVVNHSRGGIVTSKHRHARQLMLDSNSHLKSFERWTNKLGPAVVSTHCSCDSSLRLIRKNCPNLEDITFFNFRGVIDEDGSFKCLRRICFFGRYENTVDDVISRLMCNDTLEELEINRGELTLQCLINTQWTNLKSLILSTCGIKLRGRGRHLLAATCLGQLTTFELRDSHFTDIHEQIHLLLDKMPNLERLCVEGELMTDTFFESVGRLRHLKDLEVEVVTTDEDLEAVTRQCLELKILRLQHCDGVTGRGVAALCRNAGARLTLLLLRRCHSLMDDDVVAIICSCPKLEVLQFRQCKNKKLTSAVLPRAAAARRALGVRSPLHLTGEFPYRLDELRFLLENRAVGEVSPARKEYEYKELEYHERFRLNCTKCHGDRLYSYPPQNKPS